MSEKDGKKWASISLTPLAGTARRVEIASVVPSQMQEKEAFWVRILVEYLEDYKNRIVNINSNPDDSNGGHDVIVEMKDGKTLGIQVTELTYELLRKRQSVRKNYSDKLIAEIIKAGITSDRKVMAVLSFTQEPENGLLKPKQIIRTIQNEILSVNETKLISTEFGTILIETIPPQSDFYIPNFGNIGINVDFDQIPRSFDTYAKSIDYLVEKKSKSKSPWLLIWSLSFFKDKNFIGKQVLELMKEAFSKSSFEHVFFVETIEGSEEMVRTNLTIHRIKT